MASATRREFVETVAGGMFVAGLGTTVALDAGLARGGDGDAVLRFGADEPLVALLQETPVDRLLGVLVDKHRSGTSLRQLTAATALANARAFGGDDYIGFHTLMALAPALQMANESAAADAPLPVFKVIYRNTANLHTTGACKRSKLGPVDAIAVSGPTAPALQKAVRAEDKNAAEGTFQTSLKAGAESAYDDLLTTVQDAADVHRIVLAYRAYDLLDLVGRDRAEAMLRQSLRYCVNQEKWAAKQKNGKLREVLPGLVDKYDLRKPKTETKQADESWISKFADELFAASPTDAATAVAMHLGKGMDPEAISDAIAIAANQLVLRDSGRSAREAQANKPTGSVHGDSIGVHASDSAHAWRSIARLALPARKLSCLVAAAWQVALDRSERGGDFLHWTPYPRKEHMVDLPDDPKKLLSALDGAIREKNQPRSAALADKYLAGKHAAADLKAILRAHATAQDGALHAEKYYGTATAEFGRMKSRFFADRQLVALARVVASGAGTPAPGIAEARERLARLV